MRGVLRRFTTSMSRTLTTASPAVAASRKTVIDLTSPVSAGTVPVKRRLSPIAITDDEPTSSATAAASPPRQLKPRRKRIKTSRATAAVDSASESDDSSTEIDLTALAAAETDTSDTPSADGKTRIHACYLLSADGAATGTKARTYIGYTVNPEQRLRQHNGVVAGGAKATRAMKGRAELKAVVWPFRDAVTALQFEWCWRRKRMKADAADAAAINDSAASDAAADSNEAKPKPKSKSKKAVGFGYGLAGRIDKLCALLCDQKWTKQSVPTARHPPLTVSWLVDGRLPVTHAKRDSESPAVVSAGTGTAATVSSLHAGLKLRRPVTSYRYVVGTESAGGGGGGGGSDSGGVTHETVPTVSALMSRMYADGFKR